MDREGQGRMGSPARRKSGEGAQRFDGGASPVVYSGKGVVDGMLGVTAGSGMRSVR
jgi:hypothetical protein